MKKPASLIIAWGLLFTLLFQMVGTLVESIYILDLLNTTLDEKILGLIFLFSPIVLIAFRKQVPDWLIWVAYATLLVNRGVVGLLPTSARMLSAGFGAGAGLILMVLMLVKHKDSRGATVGAGMALAVIISILLRTLNASVDFSLTPFGFWLGWLLGLGLGAALLPMQDEEVKLNTESDRGNTGPVFGVMLVWTLAYFSFSAPAVIARWVEGNYAVIVSGVSLMAVVYLLTLIFKPIWLEKYLGENLVWLNVLFAASMTVAILAHRVPFPNSPEAGAVVVGSPRWYQQIPLYLMLLLIPVIFYDVQTFVSGIKIKIGAPAELVPGAILGSFALLVLTFMTIFTNVWGYVEPVSLFFRNKFWLPFALIGGLLVYLVFLSKKNHEKVKKPVDFRCDYRWVFTSLLVVGFAVTVFAAVRTGQVTVVGEDKDTLVVMTYNIQQANDIDGEKSFDDQLRLIRQVDPDVLALQESDSARVGLNNNDYVRYYASKLGYYSYYGPKTSAGTYGTAILSKYPLENPRSVYTFSDQDEVGTAEAEINVGGVTITIYNVHPDGSDQAMMVFAEALLARSGGKENIIALGDFNLRENEEAYQLIDARYKNAWIEVYETGVSDEVDMVTHNRIDHIFVSEHFLVKDPIYLLPPNSKTDHPVHWAEIGIGE